MKRNSNVFTIEELFNKQNSKLQVYNCREADDVIPSVQKEGN